MNIPRRGEVWLADCGMAAKVRPVVVLSNIFGDDDRALISVIPHTTSIVGSRFEVQVTVNWLEPGAFNAQAIFPLAPPRFIRRLGALNTEQLLSIEAVLKNWLGLVPAK